MSTNAHSLIKDFNRLAREGKLGHAYLFFGESAKACGAACVEALAILEDGTPVESLRDALIIKKDESGSIGIGAARELIHFIWQKPNVAARRSVFIDGADSLTREAENALLKVVEEPPPHGLILASALAPEAIAPALVSRFQKIFVSAADFSGASKISAAEDSSAARAKKFISGNPLARKAIIGEVVAEEQDAAIRDFIHALLSECRKDPILHHALMRRIVERFSLMRQFNTNVKLQLESLIG